MFQPTPLPDSSSLNFQNFNHWRQTHIVTIFSIHITIYPNSHIITAVCVIINKIRFFLSSLIFSIYEALQLPEELYIANKYQVSFDENGTIQRIYAFIYGKNEAGEKKTYLIDYDADSSNDMTVWIDGNVNGEYSDDMRLSPMIEILKIQTGRVR